MISESKVSLIIPTLNEEESIGDLIEDVHDMYPGIEVVIVDDGSSDNTLEIAEDKADIVLDRSEEDVKGLTVSVLDGVELVDRDYFIVMDGDFQHPPSKINDFLDSFDSFDVVVGVRNDKRSLGFLRKLVSDFGCYLASFRVGSVKDPLSGFFGIRREVAEMVPKDNFELSGFKVLINILKNIYGVEVGYVSYDFGEGRSESNFGFVQGLRFLRNICI